MLAHTLHFISVLPRQVLSQQLQAVTHSSLNFSLFSHGGYGNIMTKFHFFGEVTQIR